MDELRKRMAEGDSAARRERLAFEVTAQHSFDLGLPPPPDNPNQRTTVIKYGPYNQQAATPNPDGSPAGADYKSDEWKASYHSMRALLFLQGWIDDEIAPR